jgi:hypothetical protein
MTDLLIPRGSAILSECEKYRAWLDRDLGGTRPLVSVGANPSTADAIKDDNTVKTEMPFARIWGCGRLIKVNVFAFRATFPKDMWAAHAAGADIVGCNINGLHNDVFIKRAVREVLLHDGILLFAWGKIPGKNQAGRDRVAEVVEMLRTHPELGGVTPMCLGTNLDGSPKHTLYQPHSAELVPWAA